MRYFVDRTIASLLTMVILVTLIFFMVRVVGDPAQRLIPEEAGREQYEEARRQLGLDKPLHVQFRSYVANIVTGDLGTSYLTGTKIRDRIASAFPNTFKLAMVSLSIAMVMGVALGVASAVKHDTWMDRLAVIIASLGLATPNFWLAIVMIYLFAVRLEVLPAAGMGGPSTFVMPAIAIGTYPVAGIARLLRTNLIEILESDYIRTARAKGLHEPTVILRHALRNALIPTVTFLGMYLGTLLAGSITVEIVFAWPGLGMLTVTGIKQDDYPMVQGIVLVGAAFVIAANWLTDILYGYIDPRMRVREDR